MPGIELSARENVTMRRRSCVAELYTDHYQRGAFPTPETSVTLGRFDGEPSVVALYCCRCG